MQVIAPDRSDPSMQPSKLCLRLARVCRPPLASRRLVSRAEQLQNRRMRLRACNHFSSRKDCLRTHTEVDADSRFVLHNRLHIIGLDLDRDEPAARLTCRGCSLQPASEVHGLAHANPADDRRLDPLALRAECAVLMAAQKLCRPSFRLKRGVGRASRRRHGRRCRDRRSLPARLPSSRRTSTKT